MKIEYCRICKKEIDISKNQVPPIWFGKYNNEKLISVICIECLKKEKK